MCISRATVSAVSCLVVPAFICIDLLISLVLKINDDDDDKSSQVVYRYVPFTCVGLYLTDAWQPVTDILSGVFRNLKAGTQGYISGCTFFKSNQILAIFFSH